MEIPAIVLLYAVLLAGAVASLFYVFSVYDGAVYTINSYACSEAAYLIQVALQQAVEQPGNYTGTIDLYYPVKIVGGELTVGLDTRNPATCRLEVPKYVEVLASTGTVITIEKVVHASEFVDCTGQLNGPKLGIEDGKYIIVTQCEPGVKVENPQIVVYAS
ncbi:MAG: hypothetical protein GU356_00460 [Pyrobaculum sp.]|jgi:hypothetical protein|nr:hypothetical protein [Pyrobaculum sp.]